jgi:hypothetical protein
MGIPQRKLLIDFKVVIIDMMSSRYSFYKYMSLRREVVLTGKNREIAQGKGFGNSS